MRTRRDSPGGFFSYLIRIPGIAPESGASGPGGQHVNRTESALRLTHPPSGVVVVAQDSPSQHRNREIAFERLVERLKRLNHVPKKRVPTRPSAAS